MDWYDRLTSLVAIVVAATGKVPDIGSSDYYLINRALGMLKLLALYTEQDLVPRRWVLEV